MVKSKRFNLPISSSSTISSRSLLQKLPTELLFITFQDFDIPTLLNICNVCKRFQQIGTEILSKKFQEPEVGLMFTFEQEHKWRFSLPFEFSKFNEQSGKFVFKSKSKQPMRFIHSSMIRNPVLSKVSIMNADEIKDANEIPVPSASTIKNNNVKIKKLEENFLQNSLALTIKSNKDIIKKVQHVYRIGHGTTHLKTPYTFTYSISDIPPPSVRITRGGERWLTPISFECAPSFFYPHEPTAHKIIMTIIHLRKKNLHKKNSSSPPPQISNKQKQKAVDFEEVEDHISIELDMNGQEIINNISRKRLFEQQMTQQEHFLLLSRKIKGKLATKWVSGARR